MVASSGPPELPPPPGSLRATKSGARRTGDIGLFSLAAIWLAISLAAIVTATALGIGTCEACADRTPYALLFVVFVHLGAVIGMWFIVFRSDSWSLGLARVVAICLAVPVVTLVVSYLVVNGGA